MKTFIKVLAYVIDVLLFPIRALIGLEVAVTAAILYDLSVTETVKDYMKTITLYPGMLKEATKNIFG